MSKFEKYLEMLSEEKFEIFYTDDKGPVGNKKGTINASSETEALELWLKQNPNIKGIDKNYYTAQKPGSKLSSKIKKSAIETLKTHKSKFKPEKYDELMNALVSAKSEKEIMDLSNKVNYQI